MQPNESMSKVIGGKRYTVRTATLIASDCYWDGHNFERSGRNTFLFRTKGGAFFSHHVTQWQGEFDTIRPLSRAEAMDLYEHLEPEMEYEEAFEVEVEEAAAPGRPPMYDEPMRQTAVWLPEEMIDWLKSQDGSMSDAIRGLIESKMAE